MPFQHFLVPLDFSVYSDQALAYAMQWATTLRARLTLLHVISLPVMAEVDFTPYQAEVEAEARRAMEARLRRVHKAGLEGDMVLVHGVPFQEVIEAAKSKGADLIVMGTHGRTGLQHMLLGSVAEKVVRLAPCPVLVTRHTDKTAEP